MGRYWTDEERAEIKRLWDDEGLSASQIGKVFGATRNSIIGIVHRMKCKPRPAAGNRTYEKVSTASIVRQLYREPKVETDPVIAPTPDTNVTLLAAKNHHCRWPVDDQPEPTVCGASIAKGMYCGFHAAKAFVPNTRSAARDTNFLVRKLG